MSSPNNQAPIKISVQSVSMLFRMERSSLRALDDINLEVRDNEFLCILGPSGCGKTTLLNIIAGFLAPTSGRVTVGGKPVTRPGPDRVVVFQQDAVFPWMTVEQNIEFSQKVRGKSGEEVRKVVDRYLELVGLQEFRSSWPKQLSGGMKKRVDLARGYAADPEVILLDEPFGNLDILTRETLQEELHRIRLTVPRTTVLVTHDIEEALFLGDRIVVLTSRPGTIRREYEPRFPKERGMLIKTTERFVELRAQIQKEFLN